MTATAGGGGGDTALSRDLYVRAKRVIPGGVNSPVRAFRSVGGTPRFIASGSGSHLTDADGNHYLDYVCSWGPLILGHAHPDVAAAAKAAVDRGSSYGAPTAAEVEFADLGEGGDGDTDRRDLFSSCFVPGREFGVEGRQAEVGTVSYTHLTLPTIYSV